MPTINVSAGKENYTQRNNQVRPLESCNTTSMVMATSYIPVLWDRFQNSVNNKFYISYPQPEDRLTQFMHDHNLEPTNHADLCKGYNAYIGGDIDTFSLNTPMNRIIDDLRKGLPVVMSGTFPGYPNKRGKPLGHIICLVGIEFTDDMYVPNKFIVDDPYGNTMDGWHGSGNDVKIPYDLFISWMKPCGNPGVKWTHRFRVPEK